jgi:hypothetical protein
MSELSTNDDIVFDRMLGFRAVYQNKADFSTWQIEVTGTDEEEVTDIINGKRIVLRAVSQELDGDGYRELLRQIEPLQKMPAAGESPEVLPDELLLSPPSMSVSVELLSLRSNGPCAILMQFDPKIRADQRQYWRADLKVPPTKPICVGKTVTNGSVTIAPRCPGAANGIIRFDALCTSGNPAKYDVNIGAACCYRDLSLRNPCPE